MLHEIVLLAASGMLLLMTMMFALWSVHLWTQNAGTVDIGWAFGLGILGVLYAVFGTGDPVRRYIVAAMVGIWSVRLGSHLFVRIVGQPEEGRYQQLRLSWGSKVKWKFLLFFEAQALLDVVLSLPFLLVAVDPRVGLTVLEFIAIALWLIAVAGEAVSDWQLAAFKSNPQNKGKVCDEGLWNYSRHPNYFFEWLVWVAFATFAWSAPHGWLAVLSPLLMLLFLFRLTGIPATEAQSLRSRGVAYASYQQTTSAFFPWFKKGPKRK